VVHFKIQVRIQGSDMRVIKSDGRRKFFREGFTTILEFGTNFDDRVLRNNAIHYFRDRFGSPYNYTTNVPNENWRSQIQIYGGQRRKSKIYLKDEAEVTLMLLTMER
jgi:hypothetical protein